MEGVRIKTATYIGLDGKPFKVEYDEQAPCLSCGLPVVSASMGGTAICSWCDCGKHRDGREWTMEEMLERAAAMRRRGQL